MRGAPWYDGVVGITQCATPPRAAGHYMVPLDAAGTYFWHAHAGSLRAEGPAGALIISDPHDPLAYDDERVLQISDWWHADTRLQSAGLDQVQFQWIGDAPPTIRRDRWHRTCRRHMLGWKRSRRHSSAPLCARGRSLTQHSLPLRSMAFGGSAR